MTEDPMDYEQLVAMINKDIQLVVVSKNQPVEKIYELYQKGCRHFGESRVQEWEQKKRALPQDIEWHFIGTLQKNKVRKVIGCALIHSVDSIPLAEKISEVSVEKGIKTKILLEVNTSGEATKHGFTEDDVIKAIEASRQMPGISLEGLMTMGPRDHDIAATRACFRQLRHINESLAFPLKDLSMGMSGDFPIAIEEGATILRIGSLIF